MSSHPYRNVAIAAVHYTKQTRELPGYDNLSLQLEAALAVIAARASIGATSMAWSRGTMTSWFMTSGSDPRGRRE